MEIYLLVTGVPDKKADIVLLGKADARKSILVIGDVDGILHVGSNATISLDIDWIAGIVGKIRLHHRRGRLIVEGRLMPILYDIGLATGFVIRGDIILVVGNVVRLLVARRAKGDGLDEATTDCRVELIPLGTRWPACVARDVLTSLRCNGDRAAVGKG